ncbi:tetratricopeptide repeat protein [Aliikangiella coralliicola]|uniref:Tetratricopeptide repeat protein n=1 Tax=Aliikangiella coralliicola TaxID=2592383 RepID=A0A545U661_9GAMM|nr:tetratricopeptide repeat protein [Aliikangiella coralliicola]TQV84959.1 hypothetical protein FLL46_21440 [Aliikangiella coralliicola]
MNDLLSLKKKNNRTMLKATPKRLFLVLGITYATALTIEPVTAHGVVASYVDKYRTQLSADTNNFKLRKKYIHALRDTQHYDEALSQLVLLRAQTPHDKSLDFEGAFIAFEKGDFTLANEFVDRFVANNPTNERGLSLSGRTKMKLRDFKGATKAFRKAIKQRPTTDLFLYQAEAYKALGDHRKAIKSLESGVSQLGNLPLFLNKIAYHHQQMGNYTKAIIAVDKIIDVLGTESRTEQYLVQKGDLLKLSGQSKAAAAVYRQAYTQLNTRNPQILNSASSQKLKKTLKSKMNAEKN